MLTLQAGQMKEVGVLVRARYAGQLVQHAFDFSPRLCEVAGADAVLRVANLAIERALAIGWNDQLLVRFYLDLMITLGSEFERDPQYPWVQPHLQPSELEDMHTRAGRLYQDFSEYQAAVVGPEQRYLLAALRRLVAAGSAEWGKAESGSAAALHESLAQLYPEKAAVCGLAELAPLAAHARQQAVAGGLQADRGGWLLGALMLAFGIGVCQDPLYPWVAAVLAEPRIADPQARAQRLWQKTVTYAESAARYLDSPA